MTIPSPYVMCSWIRAGAEVSPLPSRLEDGLARGRTHVKFVDELPSHVGKGVSRMTNIEQMLQDWERHRTVLIDVLGRVDGEHVGFKPWDGAMALGELAMHVAGWNHALVELVKTGELPAVQPAEGMSMDQVRQAVSDLTGRTKA